MAMSIWFNSPNRSPTPPLAPGGPRAPYGAELSPQGATWAPLGPLWGGITPKRRHVGPLGPYGADLAPSPPGQLQRSSQRRFFLAENHFFGLLVQKMVKKKLRLRGWDLSSEIRAGILHRTPPRMSKMVRWRPIWWQKGPIWGPLGFRAQPAHLWNPGPRQKVAWGTI